MTRVHKISSNVGLQLLKIAFLLVLNLYWSKASVADDQNGLLIQKDSLAMIIIASKVRQKYKEWKGTIYKLKPGSQWTCSNSITYVPPEKRNKNTLAANSICMSPIPNMEKSSSYLQWDTKSKTYKVLSDLHTCMQTHMRNQYLMNQHHSPGNQENWYKWSHGNHGSGLAELKSYNL